MSKKLYEIHFVYVDNGTDFDSTAMLDGPEKARVLGILENYEKAGAIDAPSIEEPTLENNDFDCLVDEIIEILEDRCSIPSADFISQCQNCNRLWPQAVLNEIDNLAERVSAGEPMPSGECPACGALCQPSEPEEVQDANV